jgi:subtilisin family serine protease
MQKTKFAAWLVLLVLLLAAPLAAAAPLPALPPARPAPFDPYILTAIEAEGQADFYVVLRTQADLSAAESLLTKEAKGQYVYDALTEVAAKTQGPILKALTAGGATFQPFWIRNMVRVRGDKGLLLEMAARPDVVEIFYEYEPILEVEPDPPAAAGPGAIEWNILRVNADDVWGLGVDGAGVVVGNLDTGVQWDHPALINSYRPWVPGAPSRHDYNWYDGPNGAQIPLDYQSHGTHTMGIIVGYDRGANQIGMAPGAQWIACAGLGPSATLPECFQWFLAPTELDGSNPRPDLAPHVINNSWSSANDYHAIIQVLYAAGIFFVKAAGNEGPACGTVTNPGQWPEVTAAGSFAQGDVISSFSSRGPVVIGHDTVIKPDIAAPGSNIRSSVPEDNYGYKDGTSMACPHVTGAVALIISARPDLAGRIDVLQMILKRAAEPVISAQCPPYVDHPNDVWGWGILNAYDAVLAARTMGLGGIRGQVYGGDTMVPVADAEITFADTDTGWPLYGASGDGGDYGRTLPAATYDIIATHYGYLPGAVNDVAVSDGATTTQDIPLEPAPVWEVAGTVADTITGEPLAAQLLFEETPVTADTDPATGAYAADIAQGTWWMQVSSVGHAREERLVTVDQDMTEDFSLLAIDSYYIKAGGGPCDPVYEWMDASSGTPHCLSDDSYTLVSLPDGRTFTFYGSEYSNLYVGSNGHVTFGSGWERWSGPVPDPAQPNNGIYAFSTDLNPDGCSQGTIYTNYLEDRYFVVQFDEVEHYPDGYPETFEIILDLDTGKVTIQFMTVSNSREAVVGVENADGTEATQYAYADPVLIADGVAVDFYPAFGTPPPTGEPGALEGTVADAGTGEPIEGATVAAVAFTGGEVFSYTTGASGTYSDTLCADWYAMTATAAGYHPSEEVQATVVSGTLTVQDFELERTEADLWSEAMGPATATAGAYLTYTLGFGSLGPDVAPYGEAALELSPWVEYVSSSGGSYDEVEGWWTWAISDVASGYSGTATVVVQVTETVPVGEEVCSGGGFQAQGAGAPQDPDPENNTFDVCTVLEGGFHHIYLPLVAKDTP